MEKTDKKTLKKFKLVDINPMDFYDIFELMDDSENLTEEHIDEGLCKIMKDFEEHKKMSIKRVLYLLVKLVYNIRIDLREEEGEYDGTTNYYT